MTLHAMRRTIITVALGATLVFGALGAEAALAAPGGDSISNAVVATLPLSVTGSLDSTATDCRDVFSVYLRSGQTIEGSMTVTVPDTSTTDFDLLLYRPGTAAVDDVDFTSMTSLAMWGRGHLHERWTFMAAVTGTYYLDLHAYAGSGSYEMTVKTIPAVPFTITSLSLPKKAKKGSRVRVSAVVTPAYNGYYSPVWFHFYRYEKGKYRKKAEKLATGYRNPGVASSELFYKYRFPKKGKWRVRAEFWDEAHKSKFTKYKVVTVR